MLVRSDTSESSLLQHPQLMRPVDAMAVKTFSTMRKALFGLVLGVVVFSVLAAAGVTPAHADVAVGELSVGQIEGQLQVCTLVSRYCISLI